MEKQGLTEILSYDTDFDRVSGIVRQEPWRLVLVALCPCVGRLSEDNS